MFRRYGAVDAKHPPACRSLSTDLRKPVPDALPLFAAGLAVGHGRPNPRPTGTLNSVDIVRLLLANGADPDAELLKPIIQRQHTAGDFALGEGATPLLRAAKSGDVEIMRLLLDAGADPTHAMPDGSTALMYAAGLGWRNGSPLAPSYDQGSEEDAIDAIRLLLELGIDADGTDDEGNTALHAAVAGRGSEQIIRFLVKNAHTDLSARNAAGRTPLGVAQAKRSGESLAALLASLGATDPRTAGQ